MNGIIRQTKTVSISDKSVMMSFLQSHCCNTSQKTTALSLHCSIECSPKVVWLIRDDASLTITFLVCWWKMKQHHCSQHKDRFTLQTIWLIQQVWFHENVMKSAPIQCPLPGFIHKHIKPMCFLLARQCYWCTPILANFSLLPTVFPTCHPASNSSPVLPPDSLAPFLSDGFIGICWSKGAYGRKQ